MRSGRPFRLRAFVARLRGLWRGQRHDDEFEAEVRGHLQLLEERFAVQGMSREQARVAARRQFGNTTLLQENRRALQTLPRLDSVLQDIRFTLRLMTRHAWGSATILAVLTVGIALNVSMFTIVNAVLLRPWVKSEPETFLTLTPKYSGKYALRFSDYGSMSLPDYVRYRDSARSLESLAAYRTATLTLSGDEAGSVRSALVSCNIFDTLRPGRPLLGRYLTSEECATPLEPAVAVLSESAWRTRFDADPSVIGRVIQLNRQPFTVIGIAPVMALMFTGPANPPEVWIPYTMLQSVRPRDDYFSDPNARWLVAIGRRHREYSLAQVRNELALLARVADEQVPGRTTSLIVTDGSVLQDPEWRPRAPIMLGVTLGTTALLLLLACVNVTTLLLSRSAAREREIAVRVSLGAGRSRLFRQFLTEGIALSGLAAAIGFAIAQRAPEALWTSVMSTAPPFDLKPDWRVLTFCIGSALVAGIIAGLSPAIESLRADAADSLKGSSGAVTPSRRRSRIREVLVAIQVAASLLVVVQVGLFARAQMRYFSYDPGFETKHVVRVTLESVLAGYTPPLSFYQELESRVRLLPRVRQIGFASPAPWSGRNSTEIAEIDGKPISPTRDNRRDPAVRAVSAEYFAALDTPPARGRAFRGEDRPAKDLPIPTVISEAMAHRYWPNQDPIGHQFRTRLVHEVIGVCRDVQSVALMTDDGPFYYVPLDVEQRRPYMLVRVSADTDAAAVAIREIVRQLDPQMATTVATLRSIIDQQGESLKPVMLQGAAAGFLAFLLALTGVYAVVSFSVSQRVREIGIRMALGARPRDVISLVLRSGAVPVLVGIVSGLGLVLLVSSGMKAVLLGINPRDPIMLTVVPLSLLAASLVAIWIPASRAATRDPLSALRDE
jgi:macrolide transport system ATP-binding/permease protein